MAGYRYIEFHNSGAFAANFNAQWDGGQTNRTEVANAGQTVGPIDLSQYSGLASGTSLCASVFVQGGVNHDSGRNFDYNPSSNDTVQYTVSGGSLTPSFD